MFMGADKQPNATQLADRPRQVGEHFHDEFPTERDFSRGQQFFACLKGKTAGAPLVVAVDGQPSCNCFQD